ncbi:MAG: hypothetical protein ACRBCK_01655 [Alphaproteobacteria bacterium]
MKIWQIKNIGRMTRKRLLPLCAGLTLLSAGATIPRSSYACADCSSLVSAMVSSTWDEAEEQFDDKLDEEFQRVERFILNEMWQQSILPVMMRAAEQFTAVAIQQAMTIGMFIDAESQLEAQRLLQELRAQTHKDYHPSVGMCEFGSVMKSIAATERRGEVTAVILSQRSQDRQLGHVDSVGAFGNDLDHAARIIQFKKTYCNVKERGGSTMITICDTDWITGAQTAAATFNAEERERVNKDIDYFTLVDSPWNLTLDFTNEEITDTTSTPAIHNENEQDIMAMASNLFSHSTFPRIPAKLLDNVPNEPASNMQKTYLQLRSLVAKRSVAENSFYAISSMKAEGQQIDPTSSGTDQPMSSRVYMEHILEELGVPTAEILGVLGDNPSYYAQMEVLTKKLYQNPDFYTNLYDKPANVERKTVALQAIKLMQKFDMLKSFVRNEASVSILLELAVMELQNEIEDTIYIVGAVE